MPAPTPRAFYDSADPARWGRDEMPEQERVTVEWLTRSTTDGPALERGCGRGSLARIAPRYVGVDLAFTPLLATRGRSVQGVCCVPEERRCSRLHGTADPGPPKVSSSGHMHR